MGSFALVLFFSATGLTLNHPDWFANRESTEQRHGLADKALLRTSSTDGADKLALVELLRAREHVHGTVSEVHIDDAQVAVSFRAPGYTADAFIDRDTGRYDLTEVRNGFIAVINDLHKGRDAGKVWSVLIDASAILLVLVSLSGLILIWFMHKRRTTGLLLAAIAAACSWAIWRLFVPAQLDDRPNGTNAYPSVLNPKSCHSERSEEPPYWLLSLSSPANHPQPLTPPI